MGRVVEEFPALWHDLNDWVVSRLQEADELRHVDNAFELTGPKALVAHLMDVRVRLDRLEQITADLGRLKARADTAVAEAQDAYDDAYATSVKTATTAEYSSAKEKDALHMAASLNQLAVLRKAKRRFEAVAEAYEYVRLLHTGLNNTRWDVSTLMDGITLDMKLDR